MPLRPGDQFDRYVIGALLGKGGMGEVYRAQDTRLQRSVALKILRGEEGLGTDGKLSTEGAARLLREARAAAAMDHPNAVAIFDVGESDGVPYLAMEFISGKTLRSYIGDKTLPLERRIRWLIDMARALGAAHKRGLVHRDVKPENVMVREDGVVKVLDFGIARRSNVPVDPTAPTEAVALETLTAKGIVVGTPIYMAPEQMRGESLDGRADQFSWAVVGYELLTGSLPWSAQGPALQLVSQILSKDPEPPTKQNPAIPADVEHAILQALAKAPADRFDAMEHAIPLLEPYAGISAQMAAPLPSARPAAKSVHPSGSVKTQLTNSSTPKPSFRAPLPRARRNWILGGLAAASLAAFGTTYAIRHASPPPPPATVTPAPVCVLAWTDTGSEMSTNGEALGAYHAGLQGVRDASMDRARSDLERATTIDLTFAAAHLRAALVAETFDTPTRGHIQRAIQLRVSLSEHDKILLDAIEPWTRVPPDLKESERRLQAAVDKNPCDADSLYLLGTTRHNMQDYLRAEKTFDATLEKDPHFASAYRMKAREQLYLGDETGAQKTYDQCHQVSPADTWCIKDVNDLLSNEGKCVTAEKQSRNLIALDPQSPRGYLRLASAVYGSGHPIDGARVALEQAWNRTALPQKKVEELSGKHRLDILVGNFTAADDRLKQWEREIAASPDEWDHTIPLRYRMLLLAEMGKGADAAKLADDYVKRRAAWTPDDFREDPTIYALQTKYRTGAVTRDAMVVQRDAWLKRELERPSRMGQLASDNKGMPWILAYASLAVTEADAKEAVDALPKFLPLPDVLTRTSAMDDPIGQAYWLAGKTSDGLTFLKRAASSCGALDHPLEHTWSNYHYGMALEASGDTKGACAAYAVVLARWEHAKPRSVTAEAVRARVAALRCPAPEATK